MEKKAIALNEDLLNLIYEKINSSIDLVKDNGLLEGKMGVVLFLYDYARLMNSEKAQEIAGSILDEVWESIHQKELTNYFYTGHSGIAWALSELGKKEFLDIDDTVNSYIESIDFYTLRDQKIKVPVLIDLESRLFTAGVYLLSRWSFSCSNLAENYYWRENAIYLIEDSERILYRRTSFNNVFIPKLTLSLLNSILYFLIKVHKQKIYPYKTTILIKYLYEQIKEQITQSNVQDIITSQCLLSTISNDISFYDIDMIDEYTYQAWEHDEHILGVLAKSGLYTLLYSNKSIFEKVYSIAEQNDLEYFNLLYNKLVENEIIPIKTVLGIAHGLLAISGKRK